MHCQEFGLLYVRYTSKQSGSDTSVYAISLAWPKKDQLILAAVSSTPQTAVTMLGYEASLKWKSRGADEGIVVYVPAIPVNKMPCYWAWVFKLDHVGAS